jgi:hypothetical protein
MPIVTSMTIHSGNELIDTAIQPRKANAITQEKTPASRAALRYMAGLLLWLQGAGARPADRRRPT